MNKPAYSAKSLAERWGCSPKQVYKLTQTGDLKFFKVGNLIRIAASEVERVECGSKGIGENTTQYGGKAGTPSAHPYEPVILIPRAGD